MADKPKDESPVEIEDKKDANVKYTDKDPAKSIPKSYKSTAEIEVSKNLIGQILGQETAVEIIKKSAEQRRNVLLIGEPGTGKCVGKDTAIITEKGAIKAKNLFDDLKKSSVEIKKGNETYLMPAKKVLTYSLDKNGKVAEKPIKLAYHGIRKKAIKIITASGSEFVLSGEHPVLTIKDGKLVFSATDCLKEGQFIASARKLPESQNIKFPKEKLNSKFLKIENNTVQFIGANGVRSLKLKIPDEISKELSYFLGICMAEARWQGNLIVYNCSQIIKKSIINALIEEFDYPKEFIIDFNKGIFLKKSRTLAHILSSCFDFPLETTKQSSKKKVPLPIFSGNINIIRHFLSGIIDGDGYIGARGFELTSSSKELIAGIRILMLKLGILSRTSVSFKFASNTKNKTKRPYYRISIFDSNNLNKLNNQLSLLIRYKQNAFNLFTNKKPNTNVDIIPSIGKQLHKIKKELKLTYKGLNEYCITFSRYSSGKRNISRLTAQDILNKFMEHCNKINNIDNTNNTTLLLQNNQMIKNLQLIANSDIFWDRIKTMSLIEDDLYDFEVEDTHNLLVSGGIVIHNSMLGLALAELLPKEKLADIIAFPNPNDENAPLIRTVPAGQGRELVARARIQGMGMFKNQNIIMFIIFLLAMFSPWWSWAYYSKYGNTVAAIMTAAVLIFSVITLIGIMLSLNLNKRMEGRVRTPKVIVDNYKKKQAPFYDATGAHAGALLGDVLHDPFQSFVYLYTKKYTERGWKSIALHKEIDSKFNQKREILKKPLDMDGRKLFKHKELKKNYEAIFMQKNELKVLGETNGSVSPVEVLSSNRYDYTGEMIKLTTSENKELIVTPEHKIAVWENNKIAYVKAKDIKENTEMVSTAEDIVIDEQDIINTYDERQQEQCRLYYQYLELKSQNPAWGYKRIAKAMGQNIGKTRWWHAKRHIPVPIQTANWLKERKLLPLKIDNPKLPLIAKVIGATFGDGGIFENLNAIFLSSSNIKDTEEFSKDLQKIFGNDVLLNTELREGGEYGHSWCMSNTNRNIIRFFVALQAPVGNKTSKELKIPSWIKLNEKFEDEFYGSLFGSELGVSKYDKNKPRIEFAITGKEKFEDNRLEFLREIINYLKSRGIQVTDKQIDIRPVKARGSENNWIFRFLLSNTYSNLLNFVEEIKINYCNLKKWKLRILIDADTKNKLNKYLDLRAKGLGAEAIMERLEIDAKYLYKILNNTNINLREVAMTT